MHVSTAPARTRTWNLRFRRPPLCPVELQALRCVNLCYYRSPAAARLQEEPKRGGRESADDMTDRGPVRIALVGCGNHSRLNHAAPMAHYAAEHPGEIELVAACDLDGERARAAAEEFGFAAACEDVERMCAQARPDGVVCVMPVPQIVAMGIRMLRVGMPCTIEKPLGASIEDARRLAQAAGETHAPHMVSVNRRFWPLLTRALEWIGDRPIRFVRAGIYRAGRTEAGFIWGTALHPADAMVHIAGPIAGHEAAVMQGGGLAARWYAVKLAFANGCRGELLVAPTCGRVEETYEMYGEDCCASVCMTREQQCTLRCWQGGELVVSQALSEPTRWPINGAYEEFSAFARALRDGGPLRPTVDDVMPATELCFDLARRFGQA